MRRARSRRLPLKGVDFGEVQDLLKGFKKGLTTSTDGVKKPFGKFRTNVLEK